jgi:hypothetical protein
MKTGLKGTGFRCLREVSTGKLRPAVPAESGSANLFRMFSSELPQNRHPERSATQTYRVTERSVDPGDASLTIAARSLSTTEAREQDLLRYAPDGHGCIFHAL